MIVGLDEATVPSDIVRALRDLVGGSPAARSVVDDWAANSAQGTSRRENQDAWGQRDGTFVVADGMGGRPGGATAATAAVESALDVFDATTTHHPIDWAARFAVVNDAVMVAGRRAGHERVGAAIAIVRCAPDRVVISHVGDVRIYRIRGDEAQLLTRDHTVAAEIHLAGRDPDSMVSARGKTSALTSYLGGMTSWHRHSLRTIDARPGDRLVVCSDGVHRRLDRSHWQTASSHAGCQSLVDHLLERAHEVGNTDDRTALAIMIASRT
jgi:PPM family protein phosphatase